MIDFCRFFVQQMFVDDFVVLIVELIMENELIKFGLFLEIFSHFESIDVFFAHGIYLLLVGSDQHQILYLIWYLIEFR